MKKLLLVLLLIPSLAFATDFTSDDLLYGWDGSSQFFQTWADHTAQLSLLYAPLSHVSDTANPHHVTAAQIGVEDGATADQTGQEISDLLDTLFGGTTWRTQIPNTDSQTLSFTYPNLSIAGGNSVDLSSLQDGTGTDDQAIDVFSLTGTTLSLSLEDDGVATQTVDLSGLQDGYEANTDSQTLGLTGVDLSIAGGNSVSFTGWDTDASDDFDGAYDSLTGKPPLGTAAALDVGTGANQIVQLDSNGDLPFAIGVDASGFNGNLTTTDDTLQEVADAVDGLATGGTDDQTAVEVPITDSGGYFTGTDVEAALQEIGAAGTGGDNLGTATATDVSALFSGTGDYLKSDGTKGTPSTGTLTITEQSSDPSFSNMSTGDLIISTASGDLFYKSATGGYTLTGAYTADPVTYTLTITDPGNNDAITCSDPDLSQAINCGNGGTDCTATAADGAEITGLTATADTGRQFDNWTGDVTGSENPTTTALTMSANKAVQGVFSAAATTCTASTETCTGTANDYWGLGAVGSTSYQNIHLTSSMSICQVDVDLYQANQGNAHIEIWTSDGVSQIGVDSSSVTITAGTTYSDAATYTFTFSTSVALSAGDYRVVAVEESGDLFINTVTGGTCYSTTDYDLTTNGGADSNADAIFTIYGD